MFATVFEADPFDKDAGAATRRAHNAPMDSVWRSERSVSCRCVGYFRGAKPVEFGSQCTAGMRYRKEILAKGGTGQLSEHLERFLGRPPNQDACARVCESLILIRCHDELPLAEGRTVPELTQGNVNLTKYRQFQLRF